MLTDATDEAFRKANRAYVTLAGEIFRAVADQVLRSASDASALEIEDYFAELIKSTYPYNALKHFADAEMIEYAKTEIEDSGSLSPLGEKGRQLARKEFRKYRG